MKIGTVNQQLGKFNSLKTKPGIVSKEKSNKPALFDKVDLSTSFEKDRAVGIAKKAFNELRSSMIKSLDQGAQKESASTLLINSSNLFINSKFSAMEPPAKSEFMKLFQSHVKQPGGFLSNDLLQQSFGKTNGFGDIINKISDTLNQYL